MAHFRHELKPTGEGYLNRECPTHHKTLEKECGSAEIDSKNNLHYTRK